MELKTYQRNILRDLQDYLDCLDERQNLFDAWQLYCEQKNFDAPTYKNRISGVPNVCLKVPTGGGKTFLACAALKKIFRGTGRDKNKFVVWLVPSDAILTQTVAALSNERHPYRERLENDFNHRVEVFTKDMLLNAQNFSPSTVAENLCVCVLSYATLRIDSRKKDVRKVYQENGLLKIFDSVEKSFDALKDTPETALIQILRKFNPVVVIDESHNANSKLSVEMLQVVNPAFVLELTATPRESSNVISFADALELKREHMVKLPVLAKNFPNVGDVMTNAILTRNELESAAKSGEYVRPIVLFQAQPKTDNDSETFQRVKEKLIELGIPAEQIAIKTSGVNELEGFDLMSKNCPIRYIITVNALKEGWDCPFAYVLASLANKTSRVDVEQIVGRILRQPYTRQHAADVLNFSFVYTCSQNFYDTLESIVAGLNSAGFSRQTDRLIEELTKNSPVAEQLSLFDSPATVKEKISDNSTSNAENFSDNTSTTSTPETFTEQPENFSPNQPKVNPFEQFRRVVESQTQIPMQEQFAASARALKIPQFLEKISSGLFGTSKKLLERNNLSSGFKLSQQDARIIFSLNTSDLYKIDLQEDGEAIPRCEKLSRDERREFNQFLKTLPPKNQINQCADLIAKEINRNDRYSFREVRDYVKRVLDGMTSEEIGELTAHPQIYASLIRKKIDELEVNYMRENFSHKLAGGQIFCEDFYTFPQFVEPTSRPVSIPKSLYSVEGDMNIFERRAIEALANLDNVFWWHRNISKREFRLNGWINHYPDFILQTRAGNVILLETKGDDRDNSDSKNKIALGKDWQAQSGTKYRYFMVFDNMNMDGAFSLNEFLNVMQTL
ncbi:MAG: DEAD/DEAH box helicase family protein [Selenomonadaceae bacterium]|nr:DEAD/DEAH box helicase family protein [Selenomonadaceae bacterium]MBR4382352.1 DEAD/DEAH box helicase family protein [Selenomonadaceae bacterium]